MTPSGGSAPQKLIELRFVLVSETDDFRHQEPGFSFHELFDLRGRARSGFKPRVSGGRPAGISSFPAGTMRTSPFPISARNIKGVLNSCNPRVYFTGFFF